MMSELEVTFPGARFYKVDLHVHTPASKCWKDQRGVGVLESLFEEFDKCGIEVVAITDHNTVESVDLAKEIGAKLGIRVYPGVEVSTKEGHVLALFDPMKDTRQIGEWLTRMGFTSDVRGLDSALAKDQDGDALSITKVFDLIENEGGVAIAPHPNTRNVGFLEVLKQKGTARQEAYCSGSLRALEVGEDRSKIIGFASGTLPGYKKKYACLECSDAHSVNEAGKRFTYIKLGDFGIGALKQALYDPAMRIRFANQWPAGEHASIESLSVSQGFFRNVTFRLHPDMNAFVGGKATGKSLLIELVRFALGLRSPIEGINTETESKMAAPTCLGPGGSVTLHVKSIRGERYRIQRTVSDFDEGPEIYYADTQTKAAELVSEVFPCTVFSQNEIIELGKQLPALLDWLDSFIDQSSEREQVASVKKRIQSSLEELDRTNVMAIRVEDLKKRLGELQDKRKLLDQKVKDPILKEFPQWQKEQRLLKSYVEAIKALGKATGDFFDGVDIEDRFEKPEPGTPNMEDLVERRKQLVGIGDQFAKAKTGLESALGSAERQLADWQKKWYERFEVAKRKHEETMKSAGVESASAITSELNKAAEQIEKVEKDLKKAERATARKSEIEAELRDSLMPKYNACFETIYKKRVAKADELTKALDGFVRIGVRQMSDRSEFADSVLQLAKGSGLRKPELSAVVNSMTPIELTRYIAARNAKALAVQAGVPTDKSEILIGHVWASSLGEGELEQPSSIYRLLFTELRDQVKVELKVRDDAYKPMEELSMGSKCTAILSVALVEGNRPLIVDQPEDALDNPFVFEQIVKTVRRSKAERQYLFATHNANIAVAGDAELIFCLTASASQLMKRPRVMVSLQT
jgi:hypothetical protein